MKIEHIKYNYNQKRIRYMLNKNENGYRIIYINLTDLENKLFYLLKAGIIAKPEELSYLAKYWKIIQAISSLKEKLKNIYKIEYRINIGYILKEK